MPVTLEDEMVAAAKKNRANQFKQPKPVDPNASTITGPNSILSPVQDTAAKPPSSPYVTGQWGNGGDSPADGQRIVDPRNVLTTAAADRERVLSDIWRARYGSPENRNPAAVPGLIAQRKFLERGISEGRAAVEPAPVMPFAQAQASRNQIIDLIERENMNRAGAGQQPAAPQPTFVPRTDADYARLGDMQRMGVNDIDMRELERLSGRPSPDVAYTPMTEPQIAPPPRLSRDTYDLERMNESRRRESAFSDATQPGSIPMQALERLNSTSAAEREMLALQREVAVNQAKSAAVRSDPKRVESRLGYEDQRLADEQELEQLNRQNALGQARRGAAASAVDTPELNTLLNQIVNATATMNGRFVSNQPANIEMTQQLVQNVDTWIARYRAAPPEQRTAMRVAIDNQLAGMQTTPGLKHAAGKTLMAAGSVASGSPYLGQNTSHIDEMFYEALRRLRAETRQ